jgi:hypothetical protein
MAADGRMNLTGQTVIRRVETFVGKNSRNPRCKKKKKCKKNPLKGPGGPNGCGGLRPPQ